VATWTLSDTATPGTATNGLKPGGNGEDNNIVVKKKASYDAPKANLAVSGTQAWGLQLLAPTNYTDSVQKAGTVRGDNAVTLGHGRESRKP
jgi:hypothetical protein